MRVAILFNPKAGTAGQLAAVRRAVAGRRHVRFVETIDGDDLKRKVVAEAKHVDRICVAGGDGTVHAAANALLAADLRTPLVVLPLGTGNDLCRSLAVPLDPVAAVELLDAKPHRIDAMRVTGSADLFCINAATGGFSGQVAKDVTGDLKKAWGPLAYLRGAAGVAAAPPAYRLTMRFDDGPAETFDAVNVVVANGRTAAGGVVVAPAASLEDGLLDVILVRAGDLFDYTLVTAHILEGDYLSDDSVTHRRAKAFEVESDPPLPLSVDGELIEGERFRFEVKPRAVSIAVGPEYDPHAPPPADEDDDEVAPVPRGISQRAAGFAAAGLRLVGRTPRPYLWGFAVAAASAIALAAGVAGGGWQAADERVSLALHAARTPALDALAYSTTRLGDPQITTAVAVLAVLVFVGRRKYLNAATVGAIAVGSGLLELGLKAAFARERPSLFDTLERPGGYSFPSGHALRSAALYVGLAAVLVRAAPRAVWRWLVLAAAVALSAAIGWSRVYLGVHWLTDVTAGFVAGVCWAVGCLIARHYVRGRRLKP